jgi:hypothetical protein
MELIFWVIGLILLYLVPELLKKRRTPQEYKYPEIPDSVPPPVIKPKYEVILPQLPEETVSFITESPVATTAYAPTLSIAPKMALATNNEGSAWDGKLTSSAVLNGVIFAEILQPPKALRNAKYPRHR